MILAIDPGEHPGYAVVSPAAGEAVAVLACGSALTAIPTNLWMQVTRVVVEGQDFNRIVRGPTGGRRVSSTSIGTLSFVAGVQAAAAARSCCLSQIERVPVRDWKDAHWRGGGSMPKAVFVNRLRRKYGPIAEVISDDVVEAIGLAEACGSFGVVGRVFTV